MRRQTKGKRADKSLQHLHTSARAAFVYSSPASFLHLFIRSSSELSIYLPYSQQSTTGISTLDLISYKEMGHACPPPH